MEVSRVGINRNGGYMSLRNLNDFKSIEVVYGIKNTITNKWYIGSTFNMHDRMRRHKYYLLHNQHHSSKLQRSFNKYGIDNFDVIIIEKFDKLDIDELINKEIDYINMYNALDDGYNMTKDCRKYKQFKLSKEAVKKVVSNKSKQIVCLDLNGNFIKEYPSLTAAAEELNEQTTNIAKACKLGCSHSVKGFLFLYKENYDKNKEYKYKKYIPNGEHLEKLKEKSKCNKRTRKIYEYNGLNIIKTYNSISELERELELKKDTLRTYYKNSKDETEFMINNRFFKIEKSYSCKDIV